MKVGEIYWVKCQIIGTELVAEDIVDFKLAPTTPQPTFNLSRFFRLYQPQEGKEYGLVKEAEFIEGETYHVHPSEKGEST